MIQRSLLRFLVKERRWIWDNNAVEDQTMPGGVVDLLMQKLCRLPVVRALLVAACLIGLMSEAMATRLAQARRTPDLTWATAFHKLELMLYPQGICCCVFYATHVRLQCWTVPT